MMHYSKGENIEEELTKENLPFDDCMSKDQSDFLWMHVKGGTKVSNVVDYVKKSFNDGEHRIVVWSGSGGGVVKTISCAEILKRNYTLYQVTRLCYIKVEEYWKPQMEGLDEIVANRKIPCVHILMSLDKLDESIPDVQTPEMKPPFRIESENNPRPPDKENLQQKRTSYRQTPSNGNERRGRNQHRNQKQNSKKPKPQEEQQKKTYPKGTELADS